MSSFHTQRETAAAWLGKLQPSAMSTGGGGGGGDGDGDVEDDGPIRDRMQGTDEADSEDEAPAHPRVGGKGPTVFDGDESEAAEDSEGEALAMCRARAGRGQRWLARRR